MHVKSKASGGPAGRGSKADQSAATREKLERVARRLFGARGFDAVSSEELVAAARVTRGALYHHYDGKAGLFASTVEAVMRELHGRLVKAAGSSGDPVIQLERGVDAFLRACTEPATQRILLIDGPSVLGWPAWREMDAKYGLGLLKQALAATVRSGRLRSQDPDVLAHLLLGAMTEAAMVIARSDAPEKARAASERAIASVIQSWMSPV